MTFLLSVDYDLSILLLSVMILVTTIKSAYEKELCVCLESTSENYVHLY